MKTYIAHYYETLYTARKGEDTYEESTKMTKKQVKKIEMEVEKLEDITAITDEELSNAINKTQKRKALGPDRIPNEALVETDNHTRHFIKEALNKVNCSDSMPVTWQEGEVLRLYKGKGQKGKCSNERGITISSNMGKLYE